MTKNQNTGAAGASLPTHVQREISAKMQQTSMLLQTGRLAQADYACQEVLKKNSAEPQAWYFRGVIAYKAKKYTEAVGFLQEALRLAPQNAQAWRALAGVHMALKTFDVAAVAYSKAIEINPADAGGHFNLGIALDSMEDYAASVQAYTRALQVQPDHWKAAFNRALANQKLHDHAAAEADLERVIRLNPGATEAHYSLGVSLHHMERYGEALEAYERVMEANPSHAAVYNASGFTLAAMGVHQAAVDSYDKALQFNPLMVEAYFNKGVALHQLAQYDEALDCYQKVLGFSADHADVYYLAANALNESRRHTQAIGFYDQAIALGKNTPELQLNKSIAYASAGDYRTAIELLDLALSMDPLYADAFNILSTTRRQMRQHEVAIESADRALQLRPGFASAWNNRGLAMQAMGSHVEALASFDAALQADEDFVDAQFNRAQVLTRLGQGADAAAAYVALLEKSPKYPYALGSLVHTELNQCIWDAYYVHSQHLRESVREGLAADAPFSFLSVGSSAEEQLACATQFTQDKFPPLSPLWTGALYAHSRIRVAYVSADFGEHPTSYLMAGLVEKHDRQRFEVFGIALKPVQDSATGRRVQAGFDHFLDVSQMDDAHVARLLRDSEIDIAVDLMGYTQNNRTGIFARRVAPVQVNYLGFPGTMGSTYMDYILADEVLIPEAERDFYAEKVVLLPGSFQVNDDRRVAAAHVPTRASCGLPDEGLVFCSFNGAHKLNPEFFAIWMRLLQQVPGSVLWLVAAGTQVEENLRRHAQRQGVDAARLVFAPKLPYAEHLARLSQADLFLDSLPFGAGATASDALFAGVPLLTCAGGAFAGRMAASLLNSLGLAEALVAADLAKYESIALQLAKQPEALRALRQQLAVARKTSSLFDTAAFCRYLEQAYETMQTRVNNGMAASGFKVER